jgi:hypothetical protein
LLEPAEARRATLLQLQHNGRLSFNRAILRPLKGSFLTETYKERHSVVVAFQLMSRRESRFYTLTVHGPDPISTRVGAREDDEYSVMGKDHLATVLNY